MPQERPQSTNVEGKGLLDVEGQSHVWTHHSKCARFLKWWQMVQQNTPPRSAQPSPALAFGKSKRCRCPEARELPWPWDAGRQGRWPIFVALALQHHKQLLQQAEHGRVCLDTPLCPALSLALDATNPSCWTTLAAGSTDPSILPKGRCNLIFYKDLVLQ